MMLTNRLALVLALALGATLAGCGSDPSMQGDDDGGGGGNHPIPLDATGTYKMQSTFDLATNIPGTAGEVINTVITATDNPDDPTRWIVDQLIGQLPDDLKSKIDSFGKELIIAYVNDKFNQYAPGAVLDVKTTLHDLGDMAKHFRLDETLQFTKVGNDYVATRTVVGVHYKLDNVEGDVLLANARLTNIVVENVPVTMDQTGQLTIGAHNVAVPYGKMVRLGLDGAIIPLIDSSAHSLNELLSNKINCDTVADAIVSKIGDIGGIAKAVIATACRTGLTAGSNYLYSKMDAIDAGVQFSLNGSARAIDTNADHKVDTIQFGNWSGTLSYGSTPTPLLPATFTGARM